MSTGFKNNNYGNLNWDGKTDWEGWTGKYTITSDGERNMIFENPIYGLRALMIVEQSYINKDLTGIIDFLSEYSPAQSSDDRYLRAVKIANKYFNTSISNLNLDLSDNCLISLAKGIVATEIPEYNLVPDEYYNIAIRYVNSGDDTEAKQYTTTNIKASSGASSFVVIIALAFGITYFMNRK